MLPFLLPPVIFLLLPTYTFYKCCLWQTTLRHLLQNPIPTVFIDTPTTVQTRHLAIATIMTPTDFWSIHNYLINLLLIILYTHTHHHHHHHHLCHQHHPQPLDIYTFYVQALPDIVHVYIIPPPLTLPPSLPHSASKSSNIKGTTH